jgi:ribosomal protein L11 methyltransferase
VARQVLDILDGEGLSVAGFEDAEQPERLWRIELLHHGPPDERRLGAALVPALGTAGLRAAAMAARPVAAADWLSRTREQFPPQTVGRFWIHGSHVADPAPDGLVPICVDAGLAFGSGEHATTRSCLLALDGLARRRRFGRVLDLGCGAGILAIAAAKCWPARVVAADIDPVAVEVARSNALINRVAHAVQAVESAGLAQPRTRLLAPYDLIFANILAEPLIRLAPELARLLDAAGTLVLSGLLDRQAGAVAAAYRGRGLKVERLIADGRWATLLVVARSRSRRAGLLGELPGAALGLGSWRYDDGSRSL